MGTRAAGGYPEHWSGPPSIPMVCKARMAQNITLAMCGLRYPRTRRAGHTHVHAPGNAPLLPDTERKRVGMLVSSVIQQIE